MEVPDGDLLIPLANQLIGQFSEVIATVDWHPANHISFAGNHPWSCLLYTSPSPRDATLSRMPSSA